MPQLLECVPNFSEGKDHDVIQALADAIRSIPNVQLLNIDSGEAANRTVFTFAGAPQAVVDAAFAAIQKASDLIDMSTHKGEHPRMGATDVCPLIPLKGMDMDEAVQYSQQLAKRVGEELQIPVFLYEQSASRPERSNLAQVRKGGYEGMQAKLEHPDWKPDYGPVAFNRQSGTTAIGARKFLIAYNINLNTKWPEQAHQVACDVRESGRIEKDPQTGNALRYENGQLKRIPGTLKAVKAMGWYIKEFGLAQISMNVTDIEITPLHTVFEEVVEKANARGLRVTGSEIVGMVPKQVLLEAGQYFLEKQGATIDKPEHEIIEIAVLSLELNDIVPFKPEAKIIEYQLGG